jgi:hypothetical protein
MKRWARSKGKRDDKNIVKKVRKHVKSKERRNIKHRIAKEQQWLRCERCCGFGQESGHPCN